MDSIKALGDPIKRFTSSMSVNGSTATKRGTKKPQSVRRNSLSFTRRRSIGRRKSLPCSSQKVPDSWLRVYQAELKKERKRQQAVFAKKNAERSVRQTYFRNQHCLPRQTTNVRKPAAKDDSFFGAFRGLSLDGLTRGTQGPPAGNGDQCKVM